MSTACRRKSQVAESKKGERVDRVFILVEEDESEFESDRLPVKDTSHFPGPVEVLSESLVDIGPGGPMRIRTERHGDVLVKCTTIFGSRRDIVGCWPFAESLIPISQGHVTVTLESTAEEES